MRCLILKDVISIIDNLSSRLEIRNFDLMPLIYDRHDQTKGEIVEAALTKTSDLMTGILIRM